MKSYHTFWKQGTKQGTYKTKSLTDYHKHIHTSGKTDYASTMELDTSIPWPFGVYAEIIAVTNKQKPTQNKPFPSL